MRFLALLPLALSGAALADGAHSGIVTPRTGPEPSDLLLFVLAGVGVWLVRRAMRRRFRKD